MSDKDDKKRIESREDATQALIKCLQKRYPEKGFMLNPNIKFCTSRRAGDGLCVVAQARIQKDETLLVFPKGVELDACSVMDGTPSLRSLQKKLETKLATYYSPSVGMEIETDDMILAVAIMRVLAKKFKLKDSLSFDVNSDSDHFVFQAATWPSEEEMKNSSMLYWDESKVEKLWNKSSITKYFHLDILRKLREGVFKKAIFPLLKTSAHEYIDPSLPSNSNSNGNQKKALYNTFLYALSLVRSRANGSKTSPHLIPLTELFNGNSERIDQGVSAKHQKLKINGKIALGKWPFIKGPLYGNECNLACSSIYAARDIEKGEEIIISYGNLSPIEFMFRYGTIPKDLLHHHDIAIDVDIYCKPSLVPPEHTMRAMCLERAGYPLDELKSNEVPLCHLSTTSTRDELEAYAKDWGEPECVKCMQQFIILSKVANHEEVEVNYNTGRLRGNFLWNDVVRYLIELIDYNLEILSLVASTSAEDVERAALPDVPGWEKTALLTRVVYRENLIMWRHAIMMNNKRSTYMIAGLNIPPCVADGGCAVCGRTYPSSTCSRCKQIKYCSRRHQALDWKSHKSECKKI